MDVDVDMIAPADRARTVAALLSSIGAMSDACADLAGAAARHALRAPSEVNDKVNGGVHVQVQVKVNGYNRPPNAKPVVVPSVGTR